MSSPLSQTTTRTGTALSEARRQQRKFSANVIAINKSLNKLNQLVAKYSAKRYKAFDPKTEKMKTVSYGSNVTVYVAVDGASGLDAKAQAAVAPLTKVVSVPGDENFQNRRTVTVDAGLLRWLQKAFKKYVRSGSATLVATASRRRGHGGISFGFTRGSVYDKQLLDFLNNNAGQYTQGLLFNDGVRISNTRIIITLFNIYLDYLSPIPNVYLSTGEMDINGQPVLKKTGRHAGANRQAIISAARSNSEAINTQVENGPVKLLLQELANGNFPATNYDRDTWIKAIGTLGVEIDRSYYGADETMKAQLSNVLQLTMMRSRQPKADTGVIGKPFNADSFRFINISSIVNSAVLQRDQWSQEEVDFLTYNNGNDVGMPQLEKAAYKAVVEPLLQQQKASYGAAVEAKRGMGMTKAKAEASTSKSDIDWNAVQASIQTQVGKVSPSTVTQLRLDQERQVMRTNKFNLDQHSTSA